MYAYLFICLLVLLGWYYRQTASGQSGSATCPLQVAICGATSSAGGDRCSHASLRLFARAATSLSLCDDAEVGNID
jgi:hypothetical protein